MSNLAGGLKGQRIDPTTSGGPNHSAIGSRNQPISPDALEGRVLLASTNDPSFASQWALADAPHP